MRWFGDINYAHLTFGGGFQPILPISSTLLNQHAFVLVICKPPFGTWQHLLTLQKQTHHLKAGVQYPSDEHSCAENSLVEVD